MGERFLHKLKGRCGSEVGLREVLTLALPRILSTGSWAVQQFVDRMFLTWYSSDAIAAATPAGMLNFAVMSLFIGMASYVGTFVAQYFGSGRLERVGPALWQGLYVALAGGILVMGIIPLARPLFDFIGHDAAVRKNEVVYFQYLCTGAVWVIASASLSGFFSGIGRTKIVMWVNIEMTAINILLDYLRDPGKVGRGQRVLVIGASGTSPAVSSRVGASSARAAVGSAIAAVSAMSGQRTPSMSPKRMCMRC